ncbi:MAG: UDP-N-acetylmuramate--L-alanine ligase [Actinomycetaceae bacterium]|nr:UDP-N-acetylmuramate--L-alanine ligase [Actinomycetaceae bacterium]
MTESTPYGAFHFIGIGGAGMSVVAELLATQGESVTGSDQADGSAIDRLRRLGIEVTIGHDAANVPREATVVVSTAIRETNVELVAARQREQRVIHRSQALALAARGTRFVAVAGAHGKTTTSGMLAAALGARGIDASFAVGGVVAGFDTGAHVGRDDIFIAEADESDASFLNYHPRIALVTNVEPDHLDHYGSKEKFEQAFVDFAECIEPGGALIVCADDEGARALGNTYRSKGGRVYSYGTTGAQDCGQDVDSHLELHHVELESGRSTAFCSFRNSDIEFQLSVGGFHNVLNACGALLVGHELGIDMRLMARALAAFRGTGRRFEFRGAVAGRQLFDDYAHHPSEVAATLKQARTAAGQGRVVVLFQPHLFSRTANFASRFAREFAAADQVIFTDIFAAREDPIEGVTSDLIASQVTHSEVVSDLREAAVRAADATGSGDICITMGAGSVTDMAAVIIERWETTL